MQIDPLISMALVLQENPTAYALLLGAGVSYPAGIPNGWQVVLRLIARVAGLEGADAAEHLEAWWRSRYGEEPTYSKVLEAVAPGSGDRQKLLESFFEPTSAEIEEGKKLPTVAHKAIADLAARGYIQLVLTTNFDRLMERAFEAAGVNPVVVSTPSAVRGMPPLHLGKPTIVKLNGDYLDLRTKNTTEELNRYHRDVAALLRRVLDDYGLIISGWSADWDEALRKALVARRGGHFGVFWHKVGEFTENARQTAESLRARVIEVPGADQLFTSLRDHVVALEAGIEGEPVTPQLAAAEVKNHLAPQPNLIKLSDQIRDLTSQLLKAASGDDFDARAREDQEPERIVARLHRYEVLTWPLLHAAIVGAHWSPQEAVPIWRSCLDRLANPPGKEAGVEPLLSLRRYPATLLFYGIGIAAMAGERWAVLRAIFREVVNQRDKTQNAPEFLSCAAVLSDAAAKLPGKGQRYLPGSDYAYEVLREPLRSVVPADHDYEDLFDRLEYLVALATAGRRKAQDRSVWGPPGRFAWKYRSDDHVAAAMAREMTQEGNAWPPVSQGLLELPPSAIRELMKELQELYSRFTF